VLLGALQSMEQRYDYVVVDCPPSLGFLTVNALRACSEALIPIDMSVFSLQGVARLLEICQLLEGQYGHQIRTRALATICNPHTVFAREVLRNVEEHFGQSRYQTVIHESVRVREAAGFGVPILAYAESCRVTADYVSLAEEVVAEETSSDVRRVAAQIGPQLMGEETIFTYRDPSASEVQLAGDFSNWEPVEGVMTRQAGDDTWWGSLRLERGTYQYRFIVDGEWRADPCNTMVSANEFGEGNSLVTVADG
jgi:hypothetical protein